jgi:hypothetical protein
MLVIQMSGCPPYRRAVWTVQDEFLQANSDQYYELVNRRASHEEFNQFFHDICFRWFRLWPPERALFPGLRKNSPLSAEQAVVVMRSVRKIKEVSKAHLDSMLFH